MTLAIEQVESRHVAVVTSEAPMSQMPEAVGAGFARVMEFLASRGVAPVGPPMAMYPGPMVEGQPMTVQTAIPVSLGVVSDGDVEVVSLPAGPVAVRVHVGPYTGLGAVYSAMMAEMEASGLSVVGPPREIYLNDPGEVPESQLMTRIEFPIERPAM